VAIATRFEKKKKAKKRKREKAAININMLEVMRQKG